MTEYNIYKIPAEKRDVLFRKFEAVKLASLGKISSHGYTMQLFFPKEADKRPIEWLQRYLELYPNETLKNAQSVSYHAAFVLDKPGGTVWVVSHGKTHFYLQEFCDHSFGIDIAERISDRESINIKNSKVYGGKRSKSITTYGNNASMDIEYGEAVMFLKSRTIDKSKWGKTISFGTSVLFSIPKLKPANLPGLIERIEAVLKEPPRFELPHTREIKNKGEIQKLDRKLLACLKNSNYTIGIEEQNLSGIHFVFQNNCRYRVFTSNNSDIKMDSLDGQVISNYIQTNGITDVNDVKVQCIPEQGSSYTQGLKKYIEYQDNEYNTLVEGKWHRFNLIYVDSIKLALSSIPVVIEEQFKFSKQKHEQFQNTTKSTIKYGEYYFNSKVLRPPRFILGDRKMVLFHGAKIECCDSYDTEEKTIYAVKIGDWQPLNYVIQQSLASVQYLKENNKQIMLESKTYEVEKVGIWLLIPKKKKEITDLNEIGSFVFKMGLVQWARECNLTGLTPVVKIGYIEN